MNRSLLTPRWLLLHLLFVAAVLTTGWFAWWQWERAHEAGGSFQNLGYALQWPLFGAFTLFFWYRLARMDRARTQADTAGDETSVADERTQSQVSRSGKRPLVPPPAPPVDADEDPELAAYNRYLADLNEPDRPS